MTPCEVFIVVSQCALYCSLYLCLPQVTCVSCVTEFDLFVLSPTHTDVRKRETQNRKHETRRPCALWHIHINVIGDDIFISVVPLMPTMEHCWAFVFAKQMFLFLSKAHDGRFVSLFAFFVFRAAFSFICKNRYTLKKLSKLLSNYVHTTILISDCW